LIDQSGGCVRARLCLWPTSNRQHHKQRHDGQ